MQKHIALYIYIYVNIYIQKHPTEQWPTDKTANASLRIGQKSWQKHKESHLRITYSAQLAWMHLYVCVCMYMRGRHAITPGHVRPAKRPVVACHHCSLKQWKLVSVKISVLLIVLTNDCCSYYYDCLFLLLLLLLTLLFLFFLLLLHARECIYLSCCCL